MPRALEHHHRMKGMRPTISMAVHIYDAGSREQQGLDLFSRVYILIGAEQQEYISSIASSAAAQVDASSYNMTVDIYGGNA